MSDLHGCPDDKDRWVAGLHSFSLSRRESGMEIVQVRHSYLFCVRVHLPVAHESVDIINHES